MSRRKRNDVLHKARVKTMKLRLARAQRHAQQYVKPGVSLVDELIAERREAAKRE